MGPARKHVLANSAKMMEGIMVSASVVNPMLVHIMMDARPDMRRMRL